MTILIFLIPIALIMSALGLVCFLWTLKNKQYDDPDGAANRILFEDKESDVSKNKK